jgi:phosphatidylserine/phosphatidylglycerophosphate/cardiolipin synthase-like enzyme
MSAGKVPFAAPTARARFVVTLPQRPSKLEEALKVVSPDGAPALTATNEAFLHLARRSKRRLVLITPFIDTAGIKWALELLMATEAPEKILIVRDRAQFAVYEWETTQLAQIGTEILEYRVLHPAGTRLKPIETFHAKIVMADGSAAYVGSANLLHSSIEVALECGFVIEGHAVRQVADVVEAIISVARAHSAAAEANVDPAS